MTAKTLRQVRLMSWRDSSEGRHGGYSTVCERRGPEKT